MKAIYGIYRTFYSRPTWSCSVIMTQFGVGNSRFCAWWSSGQRHSPERCWSPGSQSQPGCALRGQHPLGAASSISLSRLNHHHGGVRPPPKFREMGSPSSIASRGMRAASVLSSVNAAQITYPCSLRRLLCSTCGLLWLMLDAEAGGKHHHLPLSLCPPRGPIAQRQLRQ
jgi:hypothetical protein